MARRSPPVIVMSRDTTQVFLTPEHYVVCHLGEPIGIRRGVDYGRTIYPNPGHALRQAAYLNDLMGCNDFTVRRLVLAD